MNFGLPNSNPHNQKATTANIFCLVCLVFIFLFAAYKRFSLPPAPVADFDVFGYLQPALSFLDGSGFIHAYSRSFIYPLLVLLSTLLFRSMNGITIMQHSVGLLSGIVLLLIWKQAGKNHKKQGITGFLFYFFQLSCVAYYLLSAKIIMYEHAIRPESTFFFFGFVLIYCCIRVIHESEVNHRLPKRIFSFTVFLNLFLFILFPRWGLGALFILGWQTYSLFRFQFSLKEKARIFLLPVFLYLLLIYLPEFLLADKYDRDSRIFPLKQFYYTHAGIAQKAILQNKEEFHSEFEFTGEDCNDLARELDVRKYYDTSYALSGFIPDPFMYGKADSILVQKTKLLAQEKYGDDRGWQEIYFSYVIFIDKLILTQNYSEYLAKVISQVRLYYLSHAKGTDQFKLEGCMMDYPITYECLLLLGDSGHAFFTKYKNQVSSAEISFIEPAVLRFFIQQHRLGYLSACFMIPLIFLWLIFSREMEASSLDVFSLKTCFFLFLLHFFLVLTVALTHTFANARYLHSIFPFLILWIGYFNFVFLSFFSSKINWRRRCQN